MRSIIVLIVGCQAFTGCSTIILGSKAKPIPFVCSMPYPQEILVLAKAGTIVKRHPVLEDTTWITLKRKEKFFKRKEYQVLYIRSGHATDTVSLRPKVSPWFWGNIPLGGIWIFIDGGTGAMYQFPKVVKH
ncbi:MAG: hypothetical protein U5K54_05790 [Cytophagales bacterium]|nr:hypothetical protein [Cytophagales bacterium]